jgi:site-specific DNA recombinase
LPIQPKAMKNKIVVGYARISNEDQSHFSISGQQQEFENYCNKNNYDLVKVFTDEGQSAKDFERKEWKELEKFLKANHKNIDYLLVMKYDRFSRNVQQALNVITRLEEVYKIKIISIAEPIGLPPESPFYFQLRTQMLLQAHVERLIISDRTKFGQNKARNDGRYLGMAPYGYKNSRDANKKPIIEIVENEAFIIQNIFGWYLQGYTVAEIKRKSKAIGFTKTGKDNVFRILTNKTYIGLIRIKAYNHEPEKYVKGIHETIISDDDFYRVQALLSRTELPKRQYNEAAYLKQVIVCAECYRPMTCGNSKGKTKYYWYYECTTHRRSFNVDVAHAKFNQILSLVTFSENQILYLKSKVRDNLEKEIQKNNQRFPDLVNQKTALLRKKENLEEKYISGKLDDQTFVTWRTKFTNELQLIESQIKLAITQNDKYWTRLDEKFENLKNLESIFERADVQQKKTFIELAFGKQLTYDGNIYRTQFLNQLFADKALILNHKQLLEYIKKTDISEKYPFGVEAGEPTEHLISFVDYLQSILTA